MLFRQEFLEGIRTGAVTLAFRRWRRASVRSGGTLLTGIGQIEIGNVGPVSVTSITQSDARRAGYESRKALLGELDRVAVGDIYRIEIRGVRPDPRIALRECVPDAVDLEKTRLQLRRLDAGPTRGGWTRATLAVIARHPGVRAGDLCGLVGMDREPFKLNVRKLKALGLTESLGTGYRLSPRGEAVLAALKP